jgi:hypothetical protein
VITNKKFINNTSYKAHMASKIVDITPKNWHKYRDFLVQCMQREFPKDEQLTEQDLFHRVSHPTEYKGDANHFVTVIEQDSPLGFLIFHAYSTPSEPIALLEYGAVLGNNKSQGYGSKMMTDANEKLKNLGVVDIIGECEPVPRIVGCKVHQDLPNSYKGDGENIIFARGNLNKQLEGIEKRNKLWEKLGSIIVKDFPYCQPNLNPEVHESYAGEHRVPLDMQIFFVGEERSFSGQRLKEIATSIARFNYHLGEQTEQFIDLQTRVDHAGNKFSADSSFRAMPFSVLYQMPCVVEAYQQLGLRHNDNRS